MAQAGLGVVVKGSKALNKALMDLPDNVYKRAVGSATNYAMTPVVSSARKTVRSVSSLVAKSIGKKSKKYKQTMSVVTVAGPRKGFKDPETGHNPSHTAHLIEYGTEPHAIYTEDTGGVLTNIDDPRAENIGFFGQTVLHPGTDAVPFMRPAWHTNANKVFSRYKQKIAAGINKERRKLANK